MALEDGKRPSEGSGEHILHCISYLKQLIMCYGDTTLEKALMKNGTIVAATNAWGTVHECRSYDSLYKWATEMSFESK
jgi:hypothetical protein